MFSQASAYALSALTHLAIMPPGEWALTARLARCLDIPSHYLAKVLQTLARRGLLESRRGRLGGFRLARPPGEVSAYDVVRALDDVRVFESCIMGERSCSDESACPLHAHWAGIREHFLSELQRTTLAELAAFQQNRRQPVHAARSMPDNGYPY